eukprot:1151798-Pelagomonas_calceolata.AAC.1
MAYFQCTCSHPESSCVPISSLGRNFARANKRNFLLNCWTQGFLCVAGTVEKAKQLNYLAEPPTTQHQHQPSPAARAVAGAAASGQNMGGAVKKGQGASVDQDSQARTRKIAQSNKAAWKPPRKYGTSGGYFGPPNYGTPIIRKKSPVF